MAEERVQKILARAGYGSRRASEELIIAGRVKVNGKLAELGAKADPQRDTITVDNQPLAKEQPPVYIALNKPQGILSEVSPEEQRETVRDLVPVSGHLFIVGRLDLESEGLILLTNDGELANRLTHPRYGHEKEYRVLVGTRPDSRQMEAWRHGIVMDDGYRTAPAQIRLEGISGKNAWMRVILREGRKRQIREMGRLTGLPVLRIQRIRIGSLFLDDLKPGQWRALTTAELAGLKAQPGKVRPRHPQLAGNRPRRSGESSSPRPRRGGDSSGDRPQRSGDSSPRPRRSGDSSGDRPQKSGDSSPRPRRSGNSSGPRPRKSGENSIPRRTPDKGKRGRD